MWSLGAKFLIWGAIFVSVGAHSAEPLLERRVHFVPAAEGGRILQAQDTYLKNLSQIDIDLRTGKFGVSKSDHVKWLGQQALDWTDEEVNVVKEELRAVRRQFSRLGLKLPLPEIINFVKTNGLDECGAPYTRGTSIILPIDTIERMSLRNLLVHELFHIFSRYRPDLSFKMYAALGFFHVANPPAELAQAVSNPDVEDKSLGIVVKDVNENFTAIPILLGEPQGSHTCELFTSMRFRLLKLDGTLIEDEKTNYSDLVGRNSWVKFHPEEILAENFVLLYSGNLNSLPNPEIPRMIERHFDEN